MASDGPADAVRRWLAHLLSPTCAECGEAVVGRRCCARMSTWHPDCLRRQPWFGDPDRGEVAARRISEPGSNDGDLL